MIIVLANQARQLTAPCVTAVLCILTQGCAETQNADYYSGNYVVLSQYPTVIRIKDWSGSDSSRPAEGTIVPNAEAATFFPNLDHFPESTVVSWMIDGNQSGPIQTQSLNLAGVVPRNVDGHTEFILSEDGVWAVKYVRAVKWRVRVYPYGAIKRLAWHGRSCG
jgi:hypothetical protein